MPTSWNVIMIILGMVIVIVIFFICKTCIRDYKRIQQLTSNVYPESNIRSNLPVVTGRRVYYMNENLHVIDIPQSNVISV
jgi:hypothetical protein